MLIRLFEDQVNKNPTKIAVKEGETSLTYFQLYRYANRVARVIAQQWPKTAKPGTVCLLFTHGADIIAAMLGVLKAGKAYVPVSPGYPANRISYILGDSGAPIIITDTDNEAVASKAARENHAVCLNIDELSLRRPGGESMAHGAWRIADGTKHFAILGSPRRGAPGPPQNFLLEHDFLDSTVLHAASPPETKHQPAYIMYTSGSTGRPKGVVQNHDNVVHFIRNWNKIFSITDLDKLTLLSSFSHDASVMDIYAALLSGAALYPFNPLDRNLDLELVDFIIKEKITVWHSVPSVYNHFVNMLTGDEDFTRLRYIILGGEAVREHDINMLQRYFPSTVLANVYGQTESSINSIWLVRPQDSFGKVIIGEPIDRTKIFLVNEQGKEVSPLETGEIIVASPYVSPGYWNNEKATKEQFTRDPAFGNLYWTWDLGRLLLDGTIEFMGRKDFQVKIRGYRIEPGEIETQLLCHKYIKEAVVTVKTGSGEEPFLAAYFVGDKDVENEKKPGTTELREYLAKELPSYMIPACFIQLESFPLTRTGKIDRKALPEPGIEAGSHYTAPGSEIEKKLAKIWSEVLNVPAIGIDDNFFQLGGHSLKATILVSRIHREFEVKITLVEIFKIPTVREMSEYILQSGKHSHAAVEPVEKKEYYPLSSAQKRLYFLQQMDLNSTSYNMPYIFPLDNDIDKNKLELTLKKLITRHESLRTSFIKVNEIPYQQVHHEVEFEMDYYEATEGTENTFIRFFDLSQAPLMRSGLIWLPDNHHAWIVDMHHIISDGTSRMLLTEDFMALYKGNKLDPLRIQYKDYSQWMNRPEQQEMVRHQEDYWLKLLSDELPALTLPLDFPRPEMQSFEGSSIQFAFPREATKHLKGLARKSGATLYMILLSIFTILLSKLSEQEDIIVGTPVIARRHEDLQKIVGMFVNTMVMRSYPAGHKTFAAFLQEVKKQTLNAYENQEYPFEDLVDKISGPRDTSRNPVFDVMFNLLNLEDYPGDIPEPNESPQTDHRKYTSKFDLNLTAVDLDKHIYFSLEFCTRLFKESTIYRMIEYFKTITRLVSRPQNRDLVLSSFEIITGEERRQLLFEFNNTKADFPGDKTLNRLFEEQVERTPDYVALIKAPFGQINTFGGMHLSYKKLNKRANQLAYMLKTKGVIPDTIVGIMVERSLEMVVGIWGILKAGGAYLPLDPNYPDERINYMLKDSKINVLLTVTPLVTNKTIVETKEIVELTDNRVYSSNSGNPEPVNHPPHLVHVIYTSGSTGGPKGVMLKHQSVVNFIFDLYENYYKKYQNTAVNKTHLHLAVVAPYIFAGSVKQLFSAMLFGHCLYIVPEQGRFDGNILIDFFNLHSIDITDATPVHLKTIVSALRDKQDKHCNIKHFNISADILPKKLVNEFLDLVEGKKPELANFYGPTECCVDATGYIIDPTKIEQWTTVPIGTPLANAKIYILNHWQMLCPIGVFGEVSIGGTGVANGYLNNPELTEEKFCLRRPGGALFKKTAPPGPPRKNFLLTLSPIYKTGDLARWLRDGNIEFLGRIDCQVKIRGFRIELGEIEASLLKHEDIKEAVVVLKDAPISDPTNTGEKYLCAYIVQEITGAKAAVNPTKLREFLSYTLPDYMIPGYFMQIETIPLTPSGKVNRKALPALEIQRYEEYTAPRHEIERKLVKIWSDLLGRDALHASQMYASQMHASQLRESIGIDDNFFALGGHSLKATIMSTKIHKEMNVKIPLADIFRSQTIRRLSKYIKDAHKSKYAGIEPVEKREYYTLSSAQKRIYFLQHIAPGSTTYNMPMVLPLGKDIEKDKLESTLKRLIARHENLRTSFAQEDEEPVQRIHDEVEFEIESATRNSQRAAALISSFIRPFDLSQAPLMRSGLIKLPDGNHTWMVDMHHIISDGTSHTILTEDFLSLYNGKELEPLRLHYKDFSQWQNRLFASGNIKGQEDYWLELFSGEIPRLELPTDYKRPEVFTFAGKSYAFMLEREDTLKFNSLAARNGATLYMNVLTVLNTLFYKYTGQTDIIIGTGIAGRPHDDLQHIIGMFVNTLAMRNTPGGEKTYESFLKEVVDVSINAFENQDVQFEELVEKLNLERDPSRNPLFDISMVVQNFRRLGEGAAGEENTPRFEVLPAADKSFPTIDYKRLTTKFDMTFFVQEVGEDVSIGIEYYSGIFKEKSIFRLASHIKQVIKAVIHDPKIKLKDIEIIPTEEKEQLLYTFNDTAREYPRDKSIPHLFARQVKKIPNHIAVVYEDEELTYKELDERASRLAGYLYYEKGVRPGNEDRVGILMSQPLELSIFLFGILKTGAAYVPLAPQLPPERIKYMINNAGISTVVSEKRYVNRLNRLQWECECFHSYLCLDSFDIHEEDEREKSELMNEELWHHVGETATDDITGGGWVSSYTGEPFSKEEMDEYGDNILKKLEPLLHKDMGVLEIGCASGISMYRIAPKVGLYYGTDLSRVIIEKNKERVVREGHKNIKLASLSAHKIHQLKEKGFDLVIMNSVIQCFHGHNYLKKVIKKAIDLLGETGYLFIGDVMDQDKKDMLIQEMAAFKYTSVNRDKGYTTKTDFTSELFLSKGFWKDLGVECNEIASIKFSDKIYTIENELTKFRYDVLITIDKQPVPIGKGKRGKKAKKKKKEKYQDDMRQVLRLGSKEVQKFQTSSLTLWPNNLAYIIYTSGTTGQPKGVEVEHRGVVNTLWYRKEVYGMNPGFVCLQLFSYAFDGFVTSFFTPLISGSTVILLEQEKIGDIEIIKDTIVRNRVTHFISVPSLYSAVIETLSKVEVASLHVVTLAGDKVNSNVLVMTRMKSDSLEIVNEYGVTESSVMSTIYRNQEQDDIIKIGHPIGNTRVYILDAGQRLQPIGIEGELCISGVGLARGYLNQPELTAEKFDHDLWDYRDYHDEEEPFGQIINAFGGRQTHELHEKINKKFLRGGPGGAVFTKSAPPGRRRQKIYKTGDLARWLADGNIEFLGRIDLQVKIRGFRIELGEIESQLMALEGIKEAVVIERLDESDQKYLCGYFVSKQAINPSDLKVELLKCLPDYMVPGYLLPMETIPLTPNGKVNRNALPLPGIQRHGAYAGPRNRIEKKLVEIWSNLLGRDASHASQIPVSQIPASPSPIGIDDNFFDLGGHSLKATILTSKIHKELKVKVPLAEVFKRQTIRELSAYIKRAKQDRYAGIEAVEKKEYYELSSAQKRIYFLQQLDLNSTVYNMPLVLSLGKDINKDRLEITLRRLISRHESLRTSFIKLDETPVQKVHDEVVFEMAYYDLATEVTENTEEDLAVSTLKSFIRPFDLSQAPLMRSGLIRLPGNYHLWLVDMHHIVSDGTSHMVLEEDFMALYAGKELRRLRLHYKDFSQWQNRLLESGKIKTQENYWLNLYPSPKDIPRLNLPLDFRRPEVFTFAGDNYSFMLEREEALKFKTLGSRNGATLYMNILAALNTLFYKYTGQADIIIGSGIAGRPHAELQDIIGMFVNTLAMRNYPESDKSYETFLNEVVANSVNAFENQDVQFEELIDKLDLERDPSRNPLFDISMVVQNFRISKKFLRRMAGSGECAKRRAQGAKRIPDLRYAQSAMRHAPSSWPPEAKNTNPTAKFDMTFFINEAGEDIYIRIEYYTGIFKEETIKRLASHLKNVITSVSQEPPVKLKDIDIIPVKEKEKLLYTFNDTACDYPADKTIHELFAEQVEQTPDHIAVVGTHQLHELKEEGTKGLAPLLAPLPVTVFITYRELNERSNQPGHYLYRTKRTQPDDRVGLLLSLPLYQAISILGVLKSGAAYVPLDPGLPVDRIKYMIKDAGIGTVISEKRYIKLLNRLQWECDCFHSYLCVDSFEIHEEDELEPGDLMAKELWNHVVETAADDITASGWVSSYTGEPFSRKEMDEYGDNILEKLEPWLHPMMRVLEIGCASGFSMYRIAPKVGIYYGTDLSPVIIEKNKKRVEREGRQNIKLSCLAAHEINKIKENNFDLVIINSVIQCFHGHNYLRKVIRKCIDLLADNSYLFLGDIMDQDKKDTLVREMKAFKYAPTNRDKGYITKTDFSGELFLSRGYWKDLGIEFKEIQSIEFSDKIHTIENELTKFRYDVLIIINKKTTSTAKRQKQKYQDDMRHVSGWGLEKVPTHVLPANLAYIIYTSGTTGKPKGVEVQHRGVVNTLMYRKETYVMNPESVSLQLFSYSFDGFVTGFFTPIISGARVVLMDNEEIKDIEEIKDALVRNNITHFISVPPLYSTFIDLLTEQELSILKVATLAGDRVPLNVLESTRRKSKTLEIVNEYGVTESSVMSTIYRHQEKDSTIKIGHPIGNTRIYILDGDNVLQTIGIPGELCIAGVGLARGYLNNPELTAEKFISATKTQRHKEVYFSWCLGALVAKLYKTGDLARWLPDGNIEFLGRIDHQVKIRGFRIELGEIENQLMALEGIKEAVVIDRLDESGQDYLCGYFTAKQAIDPSYLKTELLKRLPDYMVPGYLMPIETIPLTPNGKVNRNDLPLPGIQRHGAYAGPRNRIEKKLVEIWSNLLGRDASHASQIPASQIPASPSPIGIDDNFFDLGGHSLKATILVSRIHREFEVKIPLVEIFKTPFIRALASKVIESAPVKFLDLEEVEKKEYYESSYNQKRLWIIYCLAPGSSSYHMPGLIRLDHVVNIEALKKAFSRIFERHESFRTGFKEIHNQPVQFIRDQVEIPFQVMDISGLADAEKQEKTGEIMRQTTVRPFDLQRPPLFRSVLIKQNNEDFVLVYNMHHIISDGWSMGIIRNELNQLYDDYLKGKDPNPEPVQFQYKDFAHWHNRQIRDQGHREQAHHYWQGVLGPGFPTLKLPYCRTENYEDRTGAAYRCMIKQILKDRLQRWANQNNIPLFTVLFALYNLLLAYLSGEQEIVTTVISAGRQHPSLHTIVGYFINPVIVKTHVDLEGDFKDLLTRVNADVLEAFQHQHYPLEIVSQELKIPYPDVSTAFNLLNMQDISTAMALDSLEPYHTREKREVKFHMELFLTEYKNGIEINWEYKKSLFKPETIENIANKFLLLMDEITSDESLNDWNQENKKLKNLSLFNLEKLEVTGNRVKPGNDFIEFGKEEINQSIGACFRDRAGRNREKIAVKAGDKNITYGFLNDYAIWVAHHLSKEYDEPIQRAQEMDWDSDWEGAVALLFAHGVEMIIGLMGTVMSGKTYVPLDPDYPRERLEYILEDSEARLIITDSPHYPLADALRKQVNKNIKVIDIDKIRPGVSTLSPGPFEVSIQPDQTAYVLYTSGSTGTPKGVMQSHRNVLHFARVYTNALHIHEEDRLTLFSSYGFDAAKMDIFGALLNGAALYPFDVKQEGSLYQLPGWLQKEKITIYHSIPTVYRYFTDLLSPGMETGGAFPHLRFIVLGGEAVYKKDVETYKKYFSDECLFINGLGPTESTVTLQYFINKEWDLATEAVPVGYPVEDTEAFLLDERDQETVINAVGEIIYKSDYLALGYLKKPGKTNAVFGVDPRTGNGRIYRSGDLGRRLEDGSIEYAGRKDFQVKIRGYRIEPGEIESKLNRIAGIKKSVVVCRQESAGENSLIAYYQTSERSEINENQLVRQLKESLPDYMIPGAFFRLQEFPLTVTGKIDRKTLGDKILSQGLNLNRVRYAPPRDEVEKKLAQIWAELLGHSLQEIGIDDNFFERGGHSLKAIILVSKINQIFNVRIPLMEVFKHPSIKELSRFVKEPGGSEEFIDVCSPIQAVETKEYYPLSPAQRRLYILQQMEVGFTGYNMPKVVLLEGNLDKNRFEKVFQQLISRHETLRTSLAMIDEQLVQVVHHEVDFEIEYYCAERKAQSAERKEGRYAPGAMSYASTIRNFIRPFDLANAPLLRVGLIQLEEKKHVLMIDTHHIITDGTSQGIFTSEFMALYTGKKLAPIKLQYKDYSQWQNSNRQLEIIKKQESYWLSQLGMQGEIPVLDLPTDFSRPPLQDFEGNRVSFEIDNRQTQPLKDLALKQDATLYMVLLSIYNILLSKLSGQDDIIVGTPVAGRKHADLLQIIGMFVNTLALRNSPGADQPFPIFLREVKEKSLTAFENQDYPFEELVEKVTGNKRRDFSRNPLFDVMFALQNLEIARTDAHIPELELKPFKYENETSRFDLTLIGYESGQGLIFTIEYRTRLFKPATIERIINYFKHIVSILVETPGKKIEEIEIIPDEERQQLLFDFNDTAVEYPEELRLHGLFVDQVERTPDHIALLGQIPNSKSQIPNKEASYGQILNVFGEVHLSYKELNQRCDQLAHLLIEKGALADDIIGIMVERSVEMVIGILGILKAGGAYLPLDPDYPEGRKKYMLIDSNARLIVDQKFFAPLFFKKGVAPPTYYCTEGISKKSGPRRLTIPPKEANLSYIIYTSGSTGKPKGVVVEHRALVNLCYWHNRFYEVTGRDKATQYASIGFDAAVWEIFPYLIKGASLHFIDDGIKLDILQLRNFFEKHCITIGFLPTRFCEQFLDELKEIPSLRAILTGGDKLNRVIETGCRLYNNYGPTENTVVTTSFAVDRNYENIPLGKPISNNRIWILNKNDNVQPVGIAGELCIGGDSLARGYLNHPELTAQKFDQDFWDYQDYQDDNNQKLLPGVQGDGFLEKSPPGRRRQKIYKTGDLARWLSDGNIEFLGRIDHQVKIRGYRIELGEIENRLSTHPQINNVVVIDRNDAARDKYLCAYIIAKRKTQGAEQGAVESTELQEYLSKDLPEYMIPSFFVMLEALPLTPNGKVNRKALPEPGFVSGNKYTPPGDHLEQNLAGIWSDLLGIGKDDIGIHHNFFEIGGHSLNATMLVSRIHKEFNVKIPLAEIFRIPTIKELSAYISGAAKDEFASIEPVEKKEYYPLSSAQNRLYFIYLVEPESIVYNILALQVLEGRLDKDRLQEAFRKLINRHESLKTSFVMIDEKAVQKIHDEVEFKIEYHGAWGSECRGESLCSPFEVEQITRNFVRPFDLSHAPMLRVGLIRLEQKKYLLMVDMHHIITDGGSTRILIADFMALYANPGEGLPDLRLQYKDFSEWQNQLFQDEVLKKQEGYWLNRFKDDIPVLNMPTDYPGLDGISHEGDFIDFSMDKELTARLYDALRETGTTMFMFLLAVYNIFLSQCSGQEDIVVGFPVTGRRHNDLQNIIGMFVNMLAIRNRPKGDKTFREFLEEVKTNAVNAYENQDYQYAELVKKLNLQGNTNRNSLLDTVFTLQSIDTAKRDRHGLKEINHFKIAPYKYKKKTSAFDLHFIAFESNETIGMSIEYSTYLFKSSTVQDMAKNFIEILNQVMENPGIKIKETKMTYDLVAAKPKNLDDRRDFGF